jgi:heme A synthase
MNLPVSLLIAFVSLFCILMFSFMRADGIRESFAFQVALTIATGGTVGLGLSNLFPSAPVIYFIPLLASFLVALALILREHRRPADPVQPSACRPAPARQLPGNWE